MTEAGETRHIASACAALDDPDPIICVHTGRSTWQGPESAAPRTEDRRMSKIDPMELANQFLALNADDFRLFWSMVELAWNDEDGDIDAAWFYFGKKMRPRDVTVIDALRSAVASGVASAQKARKDTA